MQSKDAIDVPVLVWLYKRQFADSMGLVTSQADHIVGSVKPSIEVLPFAVK